MDNINIENIKVRDNENMIEVHFNNGDIVEFINNMDYSTGKAIKVSRSVYHWRGKECLFEREVLSNQHTQRKEQCTQ